MLTQVTQDQFKAIGRLRQMPDFQVFMGLLAAWQSESQEALIEQVNPVFLHQRQGEARVLKQILRTIESAKPALPSLG